MSIDNYISNDFKPFETEMLLKDAIVYFNNLPFSHFPITRNGKLLGVIDKEDILQINDKELKLNDIQYLFQFYKTDIPESCIDLISLFAQNDTDILPIANEKNEYLGYFELNDVISLLYNTPFLKQNTTTLLIEKETKSYSLSELSQIVESNNISLLGVYISKTNKKTTQITLRLDSEAVNELIQSLRRYKYKVLSHNKDDMMIEEYKNRADYLDKYLSF
jgi:predicted transcriptional regulator